nr:class I SAM-dependent methyltransferase [Halomonas sp. 18H]
MLATCSCGRSSIRLIGRVDTTHHAEPEDWPCHDPGPDHDKTLMAWLANFEARWPEVAHRYNERTRRMFRYYLSVCAGAFRARDLQLWQIVYSPRRARAYDLSPILTPLPSGIMNFLIRVITNKMP